MNKIPDGLSVLLEEFREAVVQILGKRLSRMTLYGSYARGDFGRDSDMDIMILADLQPEEIWVYADRIYDVTYDLEMKYGREINPTVQSWEIYEQWKKIYPFYMNIEREGIAV